VLQPEPIVLYRAAQAGKLDEVKAAVDAGAEMEWAHPDRNGRRAVHVASEYGHKDVVAFLGSRGADVNVVDDGQETPLHRAAHYGKASVCTTLLALGADPAAKDTYGSTALDRARLMNKPECVAVLEAAMR
jgi:ankyrin repeat protein